MRLFRAVRHEPPTVRDMMSAWDLGKRPPKETAIQIRRYRSVSVFLTLAQLVAKARQYPIGTLAAELEVPDEVERDGPGPDGHVGLVETTPTQLIGYVVAVRPMPLDQARNRAKMGEQR